MATSFGGALVPYRGNAASTTSTTLITTSTSTSTSLLPARLFTAQTGHALATELLYRLLFDILNRLLTHLHRFASRQLDTFSSFLERRWNERADALKAAREARKRSEEEGAKLGIADEVMRVAAERGFVRGDGAIECPRGGSVKGPPGWVGFVLEGIKEGRIVERDFWGGNTFQI
ncbi:hypothetical protein DM02DRAFT_649710 [Periconia macrospinosa]|uniref:Uncharacterized protein n=1 Tax=Periconia macrospinosa TaxID=97972 RepID=A0A2V1EB51_9PLEO|nr:hypothetical protein DM02DRAFT_649710 [Periconia macrospinosa]